MATRRLLTRPSVYAPHIVPKIHRPLPSSTSVAFIGRSSYHHAGSNCRYFGHSTAATSLLAVASAGLGIASGATAISHLEIDVKSDAPNASRYSYEVYRDFTRWMREQGVSISDSSEAVDSKVCMTHVNGRGSSVVLTESPDKGKVVASIPKDTIIDIATLQDENSCTCPVPPYFRDWLRSNLAGTENGPRLTERQVLMLYYLCEGNNSPHFRTFPRLPSSEKGPPEETRAPLPPLFWPMEDRKRLLPNTGLEAPLAAKENALRKEWDGCMRRWLGELRSLGGKSDDTTTDFTLFCWADSVFWTRVFEYRVDGQSIPALYHWVPVADACNHSYTPTCYWSVDKDGSAMLNLKDTQQPWTSGLPTELTYTYGQKPNAELLFSHGFCLDDNPYDSVTWSLDVSISPIKLQLLEFIGLPLRVTAHKEMQPLDFCEKILGHFDLNSIYVLFLLSLGSDELSCVRTGKNGDCLFECRLNDVKGSEMEIQNFDDWEEFCDDQCDALIPRALALIKRLVDEKRYTLVHAPGYVADSSGLNERERFVDQLLSGQLQLLSQLSGALTVQNQQTR